DWGHAGDFVEGMWRIVQRDTPDDYVLGTGEMHSVREFVERAFSVVGETITWRGAGVEEVGLNSKGKTVVRVDTRYFRPTEVDQLQADPGKAKQQLGWSHTTTFDDLVKEMVEADLRSVRSEADRRNRHD